MPGSERLPGRAAVWLFVPGDRPDRFDKAASRADEVVLDLEDAVAPPSKERARKAVVSWLAGGGQGWVRVNPAETPWFEDDLTALTQGSAEAPGLRGLMVPKAESPEVLDRVTRLLGRRRVVPLVETCVGLLKVDELARSEGTLRLAFGSIDFALDLGAADDDDEALLFARSQLVLSSRLAGLLAPLDGVTSNLRDHAANRTAAERSRRLGFGGKLCVHPDQIDPVRAAFAPTEAEIAWAERVLAAVAQSDGAAVQVDGKMVDRPVVERARRILGG